MQLHVSARNCPNRNKDVGTLTAHYLKVLNVIKLLYQLNKIPNHFSLISNSWDSYFNKTTLTCLDHHKLPQPRWRYAFTTYQTVMSLQYSDAQNNIARWPPLTTWTTAVSQLCTKRTDFYVAKLSRLVRQHRVYTTSSYLFNYRDPNANTFRRLSYLWALITWRQLLLRCSQYFCGLLSEPSGLLSEPSGWLSRPYRTAVGVSELDAFYDTQAAERKATVACDVSFGMH